MNLVPSLSKKDFAQLQAAIDEAAIVAITDNRGVITYVNRKFCAISKYEAQELIGKTHSIINSKYHPAEFFAEMWATITSGQVWEGEVRNRAKDGSLYWVNTTIVPFLNARGEPEQYYSVRYDITNKKLAEETLKVYAEKLERSNQELQDFASVAAHDLQEPLRKIRTFSDRLRSKAQAALSAESLDYMDRIESSAKRMQTLINDLLTFSRVTTKGQPFVSIDLNQVLTQVLSDLEIRLEQNHGQVVWKDLPVIQADATQMHQLFLNLIGNALKFQRPYTAPKVEISAKPLPAGGYEISVSDNGIGFDEKYLDRIFTIFQRLHGRHEFEGTGIGLAVCRKILDRHSGQITAKSVIGQGSTFILTFPAQQNPRGSQ